MASCSSAATDPSMTGSLLTNLPDELLEHILSLLEGKDLFYSQLACKHLFRVGEEIWWRGEKTLRDLTRYPKEFLVLLNRQSCDPQLIIDLLVKRLNQDAAGTRPGRPPGILVTTRSHENQLAVMNQLLTDQSFTPAIGHAGGLGLDRVVEGYMADPQRNLTKEDLKLISICCQFRIFSVMQQFHDIYDREGVPPLFRACQLSNPRPVMQAFLDAGADIHERNSRSVLAYIIPSQQTALHHAVYGNNRESTSFLLENGANPNVMNLFLATPLDCSRSAEMRQLLWDHGAVPYIGIAMVVSFCAIPVIVGMIHLLEKIMNRNEAFLSDRSYRVLDALAGVTVVSGVAQTFFPRFRDGLASLFAAVIRPFVSLL